MSDQPSAHDLPQPTGTPADCPYYRGVGTCGGMNCGYHGEPHCITDEPEGGWIREDNPMPTDDETPPRYVVAGPFGYWYRSSVCDTQHDQDPHPPTRKLIPAVDITTAREIAAELNAGIVLTS